MKRIAVNYLKVVGIFLVVTVVLMLLFSMIMLKTDVGDTSVRIFVIITYVLSTFTGGMILGKVMETKKYLWGMSVGLLYFVIIFICSLIFRDGNIESVSSIPLCLMACLCGGTVGGMMG